MRIEIARSTLSNAKWYPILDVLLLYIEEERHGLAVDHFDKIMDSAWIGEKSKSDRDLIRLSIVARSNDNLIDRSWVTVDADCPRGGRVDDVASKTILHPLGAIFFLAQPFAVIVENEWYDGSFLLWMARALNLTKIIEAYRKGRFVFRHAGGKDSLVRSAITLSYGIWSRSGDSQERVRKYWACVVLDNDAKFPGHNPNAEIVHDIASYVVFVHQLRKRMIESYIPYATLSNCEPSIVSKKKIDALFRLTEEQRRHYNMKRGFAFEKNAAPTRAEYANAPSEMVRTEEKMLFVNIPDSDWIELANGFGRALSSIFVDEACRPTLRDKAAISNDDRIELQTLLTAIYQRF